MDGLTQIMDGVRELMEELFDGVKETGGGLRSVAEHLGVTDANAIVEAVLTPGIDKELPYPVLQLHVTLAHNVPDEAVQGMVSSLNDLNNVMAVGEYPAFGSFVYHPGLKQVYLTYRMPVSPEAPEEDLVNIKYYFGVLYEQLDLFADYIMFLCDNGGRMVPMEEYVDYLGQIQDMNDMEERVSLLEQRLKEYGYGGSGR